VPNLEIRREEEVVMCYFVSVKFKLYFMLQEIHQKNIQILPGSEEHRIQLWGGFESYIPVAKFGGRW